VSDCCLMPHEQFFSFIIMARTSYKKCTFNEMMIMFSAY
jgi:hypothetical protein